MHDLAITANEGDTIVLPSGVRAAIRPLGPASRPLIVKAMARLSPESSRRRFFTPRFRLSDRELDRLTTPDGFRHFALGVCVRGADGEPEGIASGRFVRADDDPRGGEVALTVIDAFQGQGIGRALLGRIASAALARGIERLRAVVVPDNAPMLALLRKYAPGVRLRYDGDVLAADIPLAGALREAPVPA